MKRFVLRSSWRTPDVIAAIAMALVLAVYFFSDSSNFLKPIGMRVDTSQGVPIMEFERKTPLGSVYATYTVEVRGPNCQRAISGKAPYENSAKPVRILLPQTLLECIDPDDEFLYISRHNVLLMGWFPLPARTSNTWACPGKGGRCIAIKN